MKLTADARKMIPSYKFGLPGSKKYPMPDKSHAANAKARATQMVAKGKLSSGSAAKIKAKANRILGKKADPPKMSGGARWAGESDVKNPANHGRKMEYGS